MQSEDKPNTVIAPSGGSDVKSFIKRELSGTTFLTLEHIAHMALVVIVPGLIIAGLFMALSLWSGAVAGVDMLTSVAYMLSGLSANFGAAQAAVAVSVVAALVVLVPTLVILDRRTRAEWQKRAGYAGRLAYKAPVYTALGVILTIMACLKIEAIQVILMSLAYVGVQGAPYGSMYFGVFLPAVIALFIYALAGLYVFKLAKGQDYGRRFSLVTAGIAIVVATALFITSIVVLHDKRNQPIDPAAPLPQTKLEQDSYEDLLRELYR